MWMKQAREAVVVLEAVEVVDSGEAEEEVDILEEVEVGLDCWSMTDVAICGKL